MWSSKKYSAKLYLVSAFLFCISPVHIVSPQFLYHSHHAMEDFTRDLSTINPTESTDSSDQTPVQSTVQWWLLVLLWITAPVTCFGNLLVILALLFDKKLLKTNFNIYVFNLAFTDFMVSIIAMPLYSIDVYFGYWPYDEVVCGLWILMDWGMTFGSIFTLVAISIDR